MTATRRTTRQIFEDLITRADQRHVDELANGEHDDTCEYGGRTRFCHCSKRRREAAGYTEPPGEVIWQPPLCPRCYGEVDSDGDGWTCAECSASWPYDGQQAEFTDDYGDAFDATVKRGA